MREIRFRVWAATDIGLSMIYLGTMDCDNGLWFSSHEHIDDYKDFIMQFTGLTDKNGKEIYEGDIIRGIHSMIRNGNDKMREFEGVVEWQNAGLSIALKSQKIINRFGGSTRIFFSPIALDSLQVLGNQYEHPHLINR